MKSLVKRILKNKALGIEIIRYPDYGLFYSSTECCLLKNDNILFRYVLYTNIYVTTYTYINWMFPMMMTDESTVNASK